MKRKRKPPEKHLSRVRRPAPRGASGRWTPERIAELRQARRNAFEWVTKMGFHLMVGGSRDPLRVPPADDDVRPEHISWAVKNRPPWTHMILEEPFLRRLYRYHFARFGGQRPYLSVERYGALQMELMGSVFTDAFERMGFDTADLPPEALERLKAMSEALPPEERDRLRDLLLSEVWLVEDVLPLDPPPRPSDWPVPAPEDYPPELGDLISRGPDLDTSWADDDAAAAKPLEPATLVRLATDPRLLQGWPAEAASWAPYHALTLLGALGAVDAAPQLLTILAATRDDDWIRDHLFLGCLARMGPRVEPVLRSVIGDRHITPGPRGAALVALAQIAREHPERREPIFADLAAVLRANALLDRGLKIVRSYAAVILAKEPFGGEAAWDVIDAADAKGRLDHSIVDPAQMKQVNAWFDEA